MLSYIRVSSGWCHQERSAVVLWLFARQFFMIGVCGAYTAFSLFSLPTPAFTKEGRVVARGGEFNSCYVSSPSRTRFCDAREAEKGVTE